MPSRTPVLVLTIWSAAAVPLAQGFGAEGHSIIAEIAQRRLNGAAVAMVTDLLGPNVSLSSISSWADDYRSHHPETANWHFVDIPRTSSEYQESRDCADGANGDCIVKELARVKHTLACSSDLDARRDALRFAVHFVGDIHQPLHAIQERLGGNQLKVQGEIHGATCQSGCQLGGLDSANLHMLWDTTLIRRTMYDWGGYVDRLEQGWLATEGFQGQVAGETPVDWALQTHALASLVWNPTLVPADGTLTDSYYQAVLPILDQQLALGGLRLAGLLNEVATRRCGMAAGRETHLAQSSNPGDGRQQTEAGDSAIAYLRQRAGAVGRPAVVLDIDATAVVTARKVRALASTLRLFQAARKLGVAVFFITGRPESERAATEATLRRAGYAGWTQVLMEPANAPTPPSAADFKAPQRAALVMQGYTIVVSVGDQPSDLAGGYAEKSFLMPNPL